MKNPWAVTTQNPGAAWTGTNHVRPGAHTVPRSTRGWGPSELIAEGTSSRRGSTGPVLAHKIGLRSGQDTPQRLDILVPHPCPNLDEQVQGLIY